MFDLLDPISLIKTLGIVGLFAIIFAESGLFFGFFLPGDSLLFVAGVLASQNYLNINLIIWGTFVFAVLGDSVGYWFGKKVGPKIFVREDSFFFHKHNIERAKVFYEKHGKKSIILARFVPFARTFAPILAGVAGMKYKDFIFYNIIGGFIWTFGLSLGGYFLGIRVSNIDKIIFPIILIIIFISLIPAIREIITHRMKK